MSAIIFAVTLLFGCYINIHAEEQPEKLFLIKFIHTRIALRDSEVTFRAEVVPTLKEYRNWEVLDSYGYGCKHTHNFHVLKRNVTFIPEFQFKYKLQDHPVEFARTVETDFLSEQWNMRWTWRYERSKFASSKYTCDITLSMRIKWKETYTVHNGSDTYCCKPDGRDRIRDWCRHWYRGYMGEWQSTFYTHCKDHSLNSDYCYIRTDHEFHYTQNVYQLGVEESAFSLVEEMFVLPWGRTVPFLNGPIMFLIFISIFFGVHLIVYL